MIKTFKHKGLKLFFETGNGKKLPVRQTAKVAEILSALDVATKPRDMDLPGFRLHPLPHTHPGFWSVWVTGNYRVWFTFDGQDAVLVEIGDYH